MNMFGVPDMPLCSTRRHFLHSSSFSLGSLALAWLLEEEARADEPKKPELEPRTFTLLPKPTHFAPKAKAMISIFLVGGPSQMDLFDPKPKLTEYDGKQFPGEVKYDNPAQASSKVLGSPWKFSKHGQCGMELSELLPHLGKVADDITLIRSMQTNVNNHVQSMYALNSGRQLAGRPTLGSWLTYGLGSVSQELPAFVALTDPRGLPLVGGENWSNGWLPSLYQGTVVRPKEPRILNLEPPAHLKGEVQAKQLELLRQLNEAHLKERPGEQDLAARIANHELAARMQLAAREAFDLSNESKATHQLYGTDKPETKDYGERCLIARRLVERGVRFVQLWNQGQSWDHHGSIYTELPKRCREVDQPAAALVADLKSRGLLDTTIVHFGGEMGRLPVMQNDLGKNKVGRDHNTYGFSQWMAGGGFKRGYIHGETDEFGHKAIKDIVHHYDWHATLLHLFGLDHEKLTFKRNGSDLKLTDNQGGKVIEGLLA
jgi:hypothetical protein